MATAPLRLEDGRLTLEIPSPAGPARWHDIRPLVRLGGGERPAPGEWQPVSGGFAAACGPLRLQVAESDGQLSVSAEAGAAADVVELGLQGGFEAEWMVYSGYQSWDAAGVAAVSAEPRASWWTVGLVPPEGPALAASALSAERASTRFDVGPGRLAMVACEATGLDPAPITWRAGAGERWESEPVAFAAAGDVYDALRRAAGRVRGRAGGPVPAGWLSWYHHGPWVSAEDVLANAAAVARGPLAGLGYDVVQVDDGWQVAYGDWIENEKFPGGLRAVADGVAENGQRLGVWTAPFLVSATSSLARSAPEDWFVRAPGDPGVRAVDPVHYVFGPMHILDARNPEVVAHLERTFRRLKDSGVVYFKIDFLYAGAYASTAALSAGLHAIRRAIGDDAYLLGCGAPLLTMAGVCDGCRIGRDTATPIFDFELGHPRPAILAEEVMEVTRNQAARHHLASWFQLDPDVALVGGNLELDQAQALVTVCALSGGPFFASDDIEALAPERLALLRNPDVLGLKGGEPASPLWRPDPTERAPETWRRDGVAAAFNWDHEPRLVPIGEPLANAVDVWSGERLTGVREVLVPARGVRLIRAGDDGTPQ